MRALRSHISGTANIFCYGYIPVNSISVFRNTHFLSITQLLMVKNNCLSLRQYYCLNHFLNDFHIVETPLFSFLRPKATLKMDIPL